MDKFHSLKSVPPGPSSAGSDGSLPSTPPPGGPKPLISAKGVENAKKRLRAFSIQKKIPKGVPPSPLVKSTGSSSNAVLIGKLNSSKVSLKSDVDETKKPPKPPKPGASRKQYGRVQEYSEVQKQTLSEIEEMKRKMELVDLGIPLGLICPTATSEKAMPTKAMPPIKSFLTRRVDARKKLKEDNIKKRMRKLSITPEQLDVIIRDAKKAKAEGKKFKFDYERLLPDYDNPFQRKKYEDEKDKKPEKDSEKKKGDKYDYKDRHFRGRFRFAVKDDKSRERDRGRSEKRDDDKNRDSKRYSFDKRRIPSDRKVEETSISAIDNVAEKDVKDSEINLKDFLVCDSWSLDNDDKTNSSSPAVEKSIPKEVHETKELIDQQIIVTSPKKTESPVIKVEKLKPVVDSFKFELDSNDDEILDIFDEDCDTDRFSIPTKKPHSDDQDSFKDLSMDGMDDTFLESVINEIKQENLSEDESHDKSLVGYDESPVKQEIGTPELDTSTRSNDYSDGYRSSESGYKSTDSLRSRNSEFLVSESPQRLRLSVERELDAALERGVSKPTVESLETWSFVLKICQPLLFRHDKNKCYKETRVTPKLWYTDNPKLCNCVKDRSVVYEELEMCKMTLVDKLYGCDQISEALPVSNNWYSSCPLVESISVQTSSEWEVEEGPGAAGVLDQEYQRFMEAVWPEATEAKSETSRSTTPVRQERKREAKEQKEERKSKKMKLSSEGWSQESDVEEEVSKKKKVEKEKKKSRKRKLSVSSDSSISVEEVDAKKKRITKKKNDKKQKVKSAKRRRKEKLRKIKEKQKKKKKIKTEKVQELSDDEGDEIVAAEKKKELKQMKKKKPKKLKKKAQKKKKAKAKSSSSSSESSDTEPEKKKKKKEDRRKKEKRKRKHSTTESQSDELFDENILNNIKTEKFEDNKAEFSPRRQYSIRQEIINVKELQSDFVGNSIHIKKEVEDDKLSKQKSEAERGEEVEVKEKSEKELFKEPAMPPEESNLSQCSSQESISSKDHVYEKDESHLRPSSQNSNYSFNDVISASQAYKADATQNTASNMADRKEPTHQVAEKEVESSNKAYKAETAYVPEEAYKVPEVAFKDPEVAFKDPEAAYKVPEAAYKVPEAAYKVPEAAYKVPEAAYKVPDAAYKASEAYQAPEEDEMMNSGDMIGYQKDEDYGHGDYEMYEQLAMAYQSDVANQRVSPPTSGSHCIETVLLPRARGEIKCDWRAGDSRPATAQRPSRWGLKPGDVNIVLTGGNDFVPSPVYKIQSLANRNAQDNVSIGYDEAYADVYAASDKLQYGDCFSQEGGKAGTGTPRDPSKGGTGAPLRDPRTSSLDQRISRALQASVLGEVAKEDEADERNDKKKLLLSVNEVKVSKRVSFADGYKPGQDSDTEEPPKKKKRSRVGCAWPCPATHPDHVPLWDALPPPPPPPEPHRQRYDLNSIQGFMPAEPPPGLMAFPPALA